MKIKPLKQKFRHHPEKGEIGDCHRTAVAMLLGLERDDVPHWCHDDCNAEVFWKRQREWLANIGLDIVNIAFEMDHKVLLSTLKASMRDVPWILGGKSRNGVGHSVVVHEGVIIDPAIDDSGIVARGDDGLSWASWLVALPKGDWLTPRVSMTPIITGDPDWKSDRFIVRNEDLYGRNTHE